MIRVIGGFLAAFLLGLTTLAGGQLITGGVGIPTGGAVGGSCGTTNGIPSMSASQTLQCSGATGVAGAFSFVSLTTSSASGTAISATGAGGVASTDGTITGRMQVSTGNGFFFGTTSNHYLQIQTNGANVARFQASGGLSLGVSTDAGAGSLLLGGFGGSSAKLITQQTTAPTCSASCGTSPSVVGSDVAGTITMGSSGTPASPFTMTFNAAWGQAPACTVHASKSGMVTGKKPILVITTTTTMAVTTDGTAPATTDTYNYICIGRA